MPGEDRPRQAGDRIESLLDALGAGGAVARGRAEELVRQVTDLYGSGLARILEILDDRGQLDDATLDALTADELVSSLLVIHGLHPQDLETRVAAALDSVRPYLGSHGGNVELLDISPEGVVRLQAARHLPGLPVVVRHAQVRRRGGHRVGGTGGDRHPGGGGGSPRRHARRDPRGRAAGPAEPPGTPADRPTARDGRAARAAHLAPAPPVTGRNTPGTWEAVPEIAGLEHGDVAGFLVGGLPGACVPDRAGPLRLPRLLPALHRVHGGGHRCSAPSPAPVGGGLLRCPACRAHFDVRQAGSCLEDRALHLDPLPLLVRGGVMSVAVPLVSSQDA